MTRYSPRDKTLFSRERLVSRFSGFPPESSHSPTRVLTSWQASCDGRTIPRRPSHVRSASRNLESHRDLHVPVNQLRLFVCHVLNKSTCERTNLLTLTLAAD